MIAGGAVALVIAGVVGWNALRTDEVVTPPDAAATTTVPPMETTTIAPPTTVAPTTSVPPSTTSSPSTSTSVAPTTSVPTTSTTIGPTTSITTSSVATTTLAPTTTAAPVLAPRDQILALMDQYETAYETLDVDLLGALYPSVPIAVKNSFRNFKTLTLEMEAIDGPSINRSTAGRTASAVYRIVQTIEPIVGKRTTSRHRATFQFAGVGDSWIIVNVQWQQE